MIKNFTALEHTIGDKLFQLCVDPQSTLGELHDALSAMKTFVINKMQEIEKQNINPPPIMDPGQINLPVTDEVKSDGQ